MEQSENNKTIEDVKQELLNRTYTAEADSVVQFAQAYQLLAGTQHTDRSLAAVGK